MAERRSNKVSGSVTYASVHTYLNHKLNARTCSLPVRTRTPKTINQAIERLAEGLENSRKRAETAEALLEELQRGICPSIAPTLVAERDQHFSPHRHVQSKSSGRSRLRHHSRNEHHLSSSPPSPSRRRGLLAMNAEISRTFISIVP